MAILRARGGRSFTTWPPMRISPEVGSSSPAIIRRRVVFPQPDGPSRTRNSPSSVERSTPLTALTSPKNFLTFLVSTVAISPGISSVGIGLTWSVPPRDQHERRLLFGEPPSYLHRYPYRWQEPSPIQ